MPSEQPPTEARVEPGYTLTAPLTDDEVAALYLALRGAKGAVAGGLTTLAAKITDDPAQPEQPRGEEARADPPRLTHGRHCPCSSCARQDWSDPTLAPCGMHGSSCPPRYAPYRGLKVGDPAPPRGEGDDLAARLAVLAEYGYEADGAATEDDLREAAARLARASTHPEQSEWGGYESPFLEPPDLDSEDEPASPTPTEARVCTCNAKAGAQPPEPDCETPGCPVHAPTPTEQGEARFTEAVAAELIRARTKFPGNRHQYGATAEEFGEVGRALIEEQPREELWAECVQLAAMAQRLAEEGDTDYPASLPAQTEQGEGGTVVSGLSGEDRARLEAEADEANERASEVARNHAAYGDSGPRHHARLAARAAAFREAAQIARDESSTEGGARPGDSPLNDTRTNSDRPWREDVARAFVTNRPAQPEGAGEARVKARKPDQDDLRMLRDMAEPDWATGLNPGQKAVIGRVLDALGVYEPAPSDTPTEEEGA